MHSWDIGHFNEKSLGGLEGTWERVMNTALGLMIEDMSTDTKLLDVLRNAEAERVVQNSNLICGSGRVN